MAGMIRSFWKMFTVILFYTLIKTTQSVSYINAEGPSNCKKSASDKVHEFFDISQLRCQTCHQDSKFQTVSADGKLVYVLRYVASVIYVIHMCMDTSLWMEHTSLEICVTLNTRFQ